MPSYLLKRRLRHVRSIRINNISAAISRKLDRIVVPFAACFLALETAKGDVLFVTEAQYDFINSVQFNELPPLDYSISHIILKIMVKIPKECSLANVLKQDEWLVLRLFDMDLNKLQNVDLCDQIEGHNVPLFEMSDGIYTLENQPVIKGSHSNELTSRHKRNASRSAESQSFSYNSALKLNIMVDYKAQVLREIEEISKKLEKAIEDDGEHNSWLTESLKRYLGELELSMTRKKQHVRELRKVSEGSTNKRDRGPPPTPDGQSLHDYYGSNYPNLIKTKDRADSIRLKKLGRLIGIFKNTCLFKQEIGFIEYDNACTARASYERTKLRLVDKERIFSLALRTDAEREMINTCLGYYLLFVQLTATMVFKIPLPHVMKFYGSTSKVGDGCCLYFDSISAAKYPETLLNAIDCFNKNLVQVIQRWEHHVSPRADDQMSQTGSR